ncbi:MAG: hypothetical protein IIX18_05295, partial [Clostridia bacterium]|nr:hypothetical protein [Clostridia bacterium]
MEIKAKNISRFDLAKQYKFIQIAFDTYFVCPFVKSRYSTKGRLKNERIYTFPKSKNKGLYRKFKESKACFLDIFAAYFFAVYII